MKKTLPTVIVSIPWSHTKERVRLDLSALRKRRKGRIYTLETFKNGGILEYQPRFTYRKRNNGDHVIDLEYLEEDHSFPKRAEVFWGCSKITVVKALTSAKADWEGEPSVNGEDAEGIECKVRIEKPSEKKSVIVEARKAQGKFKQELLKISPRCAITGTEFRPLLDAAHIQSVEDGGSDESDNGILLRADLHRLYDAGYFTIKPNGTLTLHPEIPQSYVRTLLGKCISPETMNRIRSDLAKRKQPSPD